LKLKKRVQLEQKKIKDAAIRAMNAEILHTEDRGYSSYTKLYLSTKRLTIFSYLEADGMEKTFKFTQKQIQSQLDVTSAKKVISITDPLIPTQYLIYP
jgi:hypothetical protein